jgi:hypothetical protein
MNFIRVLLTAVGFSSLPPDIETLQLKVNFKTRGIFGLFAAGRGQVASIAALPRGTAA